MPAGDSLQQGIVGSGSIRTDSGNSLATGSTRNSYSGNGNSSVYSKYRQYRSP